MGKYFMTFLLIIAIIISFIVGIYCRIDFMNYPAPKDRISQEEDIIFKKSYVKINYDNIEHGTVLDTNSMIPTLDAGHTLLYIEPIKNDIQVGDIIAWQTETSSSLHRLIEIGEDKKGTFYITQGDANLQKDTKIRFENIKLVVVGIIY